jgi:hypothetical protein
VVIDETRDANPTTWVDVSRLRLDPENPRLASGRDGGAQLSQTELVRRLWTETAVDEVAMSIARNGYFSGEPLLVIDDPTSDDLIVVEGNRRLAALKLLLDDHLRAEVKATELPSLGDRARSGLREIPVRVYPSRESLWSYLGFRHINGTKPWDAFSKAKYVADVHESFGVALSEIADRIGDRNATVTRLYRGLKVLEQAESATAFSVADRVARRFAFSHLYTAVDQGEFQRFLGITSDGSLKRNPVPASHLDDLYRLTLWLYGRKSLGIEPVVRTQNPDLNTLREVVASKKGLSLLIGGRSLSAAHDASLGEELRFIEALNAASEDLITANGTVTNGYDGTAGPISTLEDIENVTGRLRAEMVAIQARRQERKTRA